MKSRIMDFRTPLTVCDVELPSDISIEFRYHPAQPAYTPRGEYAPIDPPEPAMVEIQTVSIILANRTVECPGWLKDALESDYIHDLLIEHAEGQFDG